MGFGNQDEREDTTVYKVVMNHEEQYSIWPADRENPLGWRDAGSIGPKQECLEYIRQVWTDMRPLSLRKAMEQSSRAVPAPQSSVSTAPEEDLEEDLVDRLCRGDHPVVPVLRPEGSLGNLRDSIERRYVHIKFTDTNGGTELGVRLDNIDLTRADFDKPTGNVHLEGVLTLNFVRVRCIADLDIESLRGQGRLERVMKESGA